MCGFFAFSTGLSARQIADLFNLSNLPKSANDIKEEMESLKHYPKSLIPTISKNSPNQLVFRYWSLIPRWWNKPLSELKFSTFNARAEELEKKATYNSAWKNFQRCLIPATWFYEFQAVKVGKNTKKLPYRVDIPAEEIMTLAGLYEVWEDPSGNSIESVTILTCEATSELAKIHHRQPIVLSRDNRELWLSKETPIEQIENMLKPEKNFRIIGIDQQFNKSFGKDVTRELLNLA